MASELLALLSLSECSRNFKVCRIFLVLGYRFLRLFVGEERRGEAIAVSAKAAASKRDLPNLLQPDASADIENACPIEHYL